MSMKKSALRTALTFRVALRFLVPKCFILFSACLQVYPSSSGAAKNESSPASLRTSAKPSPSFKSISGTTRLVVEAAALEMFNSTNMIHVNTSRPSSEKPVLGRQTALLHESPITINNSINFKGNVEPTNTIRVEHADEDKSVVFYRKVGGWITLGIVSTTLVFLTITHFSSIYHVNQRGRIMEPYCSIPKKPQVV